MNLEKDQVFAGRYRLINKIGMGGFSEVWKVADEMAEDRHMALKVYAPERGLDEHGIKQFRREYAITLDLNHPNLLKAHHFDVFDGSPYLLMPLCEGGSLYGRLAEHGSMTEHQVATMLAQVAGALDYLHRKEVTHQDIKPDNVLIDSDGNYMLMDFGISSRLRSTMQKSTTTAKAMTVAYAPPEKFEALAKVGPEGDVFSVGVMLIELLTGDLPWSGMGGAYVRPDSTPPQLPQEISPALTGLIQRCVAYEPAYRPTPKELVEAAELYLSAGRWAEAAPQPAATISSQQTVLMEQPPAPPTATKESETSTPPPAAAKTNTQKPEEKKSNKKPWLIGGGILAAILLLVIWVNSNDTTGKPDLPKKLGEVADTSNVQKEYLVDTTNVSQPVKDQPLTPDEEEPKTIEGDKPKKLTPSLPSPPVEEEADSGLKLTPRRPYPSEDKPTGLTPAPLKSKPKPKNTGKVSLLKSQTFKSGTVPQIIISDAWPDSESYEVRKVAFYLGQTRYFYSTLASTNNSDATLRIFNDGKPESSKVYIYNPFGALSSGKSKGAENSFIPDFGFKSNVKPEGVKKVYVAYQNSPTYMSVPAPHREEIAGQVVQDIWRRQATVGKGNNQFTYTYLQYVDGTKGGISKTITYKLDYHDIYPRTNRDSYLVSDIYIAYCGDGVVDNIGKDGTGLVDGKQGIKLHYEGTFAKWSKPDPTVINEVCDDGSANSDTKKGACKTDCSGRVK